MKTELEIQFAHDMLVGIMLNEVSVSMAPELRDYIRDATPVLCWVLEHQHSPVFDNVIKQIEDEMAKHGIKMERRNN